MNTATTPAINTEFNVIKTICEIGIDNRASAYLAACNMFELQAAAFANNENFMSRKSAEQVSICYAKAKSADCEYTVYANAHAAEVWLCKAWNNAD